MLGLIAVAQGERLTSAQLQQITGKDVEQPLRICGQYLSGELPHGPFRPFHKSFADFLLEDTDNIDYHINEVQMHLKIVDFYWTTYNPNWITCRDTYGLNNLAAHLCGCGDTERLNRLISKEWMYARLAQSNVHQGLLADIDLAWQVESKKAELNVPELVRLQTVRHLVLQDAQTTSDTTLKTLVWLGREHQAIELVQPRVSQYWREQGLVAICDALRERGKIVNPLPDELWGISQSLGDYPKMWLRVGALSALARTSAALGDSRASVTIDEAKHVVNSMMQDPTTQYIPDSFVWMLIEANLLDDLLIFFRQALNQGVLIKVTQFMSEIVSRVLGTHRYD